MVASSVNSRAHPRSRGENSAPASAMLTAAGSSPLTRGKLVEAASGFLLKRLIPAHAGKTSSYKVPGFRAGAHPRSRGENVAVSVPTGGREGSSPLTRGKRDERVVSGYDDGLIPAHAGKTDRPHAGHLLAGAHPRSRGENSTSDEKPARGMGSSPLTRGKPLGLVLGFGNAGLIPAHAGKTAWVGLGWLGMGAHPRSRGENSPSRP